MLEARPKGNELDEVSLPPPPPPLSAMLASAQGEAILVRAPRKEIRSRAQCHLLDSFLYEL